MQVPKSVGKNREEMKNLLFYILVKNYYMYSNKHKTLSKFIEILRKKKHTINFVYIAPLAGEKLSTCAL